MILKTLMDVLPAPIEQLDPIGYRPLTLRSGEIGGEEA